MTELMSISEAAAAFRQGRLRPLDLVERCLEQIRRNEDRVHAWVVVDEAGARRTAEERGRQLAAGRDLGPLHGIPLGIKDIIDVEGVATRAGSPLRENHVARADAPLVAALRQAGAIVLGKTVTVEFACFDPSPSRNPWDPALEHSPGGSSSGSAVAVALGMCLGALGTQTGGSLVRPSSFCGISTLKPTWGRYSLDGVVPVSFHFDHPGPMARKVADLAILFRHLARSDATESPPTADPIAGAVSAQASASSRPPRLGWVEGFFKEEAAEPIRAATQAAVARLRDGGARITPVALPDYFHETVALHGRIMAVEAAAYHREQFAAHRSSYGPMITGLLDEGLSISGVDYAAALAHLRHVRRRAAEMLDGVDALVCPATDATAPPTLATTGNKKFQAPWSYAGLPVVSIPCSLASDGMPAAIQLVGRPDQEWPLLEVARWCETQLDFRDVPPLLG
jgi:Asp-tRNA(Asn)/Glu-tRNA(Gln) amidotransferase A subunit family amidase